MPSVILTRPIQRLDADNTFSTLLKDAGISVLELPMITISLPKALESLDTALYRLAQAQYTYCVLSSPTAIEFFHQRVLELGLYESISATIGFATVGEKSAAKLESYGYRVAIPLPHQNAGAAALLIEMRKFDLRGKPTLLLQSQIGLVVLHRALEMCGAEIDRVTLYETTGPNLRDAALLMHHLEAPIEERPRVVAFFSPSAVESFVTTIVEMGSQIRQELPALAAIGETTALEIKLLLRRDADIVARKANQESLANDIIQYLRSNS
ncbi:MAG: uroporphyrinogen-III synthase [Bacteroidetes bacterium]|nr:uroporphyrinogen-III synthase [Bacteroidota bacterium]